MTAKKEIIWKRFSSEEETPKAGTKTTSITDGLISEFLKEFPSLFDASLRDEEKKAELIIKFEAINGGIEDGHELFKQEIKRCWYNSSPRSISSIYFEEWIRQLFSPKSNPVKQPLRFADLFQRPEDATKVKEMFEQSKITSNGVYKVNPRRSNNRSELLAAYYSLRPIMRHHSKTAGARCFYGEFNAVVDMHDRMLTQEPFNADRAKFDKLFTSLLTK